jgi:Tfp pilus assembly protein PilZ
LKVFLSILTCFIISDVSPKKVYKTLEFIPTIGYSLPIMTWEGINQRKFPRVNYKCLIKVSTDGREELIEAMTDNIGAGGICVLLDKGFELFDVVSLEVFLGEAQAPIYCTGTVVWVVKKHPVRESEAVSYDTGIEFRDLPDGDRQRITELVEDILRSKA